DVAQREDAVGPPGARRLDDGRTGPHRLDRGDEAALERRRAARPSRSLLGGREGGEPIAAQTRRVVEGRERGAYGAGEVGRRLQRAAPWNGTYSTPSERCWDDPGTFRLERVSAGESNGGIRPGGRNMAERAEQLAQRLVETNDELIAVVERCTAE